MTDLVARNLDLDDARPLSEQLVRAVAASEGVDPVALETPLYEAIDPDALDRLFRSTNTDRAGGRVEFSYHGYRVVVSVGDEPEIRLEAIDDGFDPEAVGDDLADDPRRERLSAASSTDERVHYCLDCGWRVAARDGYSAGRRSRMVVDHYVQTGHAIDSSRSTDDAAGESNAFE